MIDFRYHLVSIIAVFLALAIGLAIGANVLSLATTKALQQEAKRVTGENNRLIKQNNTLKQQISADQTFAGASASRLLG
ncbi:MAG: copper transporter, partial [Streptosporangiaceae bacterium]